MREALEALVLMLAPFAPTLPRNCGNASAMPAG